MNKLVEQYSQAVFGFILLVATFATLQGQVEHDKLAIEENKKSIEKCVTDIRTIRQAVTERLRRDMADAKYVSKELFTAQFDNLNEQMKRMDNSLNKILIHLKRKEP